MVQEACTSGHRFILNEIKRRHPRIELYALCNTDQYIRTHKGRQPLAPLSVRLRALYDHAAVTYTKVQLEDSPLSLITMIEPDIIFVGDDYTIKDVVGGHIAKVEIIPRLPGFSTTALTK